MIPRHHKKPAGHEPAVTPRKYPFETSGRHGGAKKSESPSRKRIGGRGEAILLATASARVWRVRTGAGSVEQRTRVLVPDVSSSSPRKAKRRTSLASKGPYLARRTEKRSSLSRGEGVSGHRWRWLWRAALAPVAPGTAAVYRPSEPGLAAGDSLALRAFGAEPCPLGHPRPAGEPAKRLAARVSPLGEHLREGS